MTCVAGVSGAVCAVCRSQSSRMAVEVRMASRLHMASTVCKQRSSNKQPVLRTLWKSSTNHRHLYHVTRCQASSKDLPMPNIALYRPHITFHKAKQSYFIHDNQSYPVADCPSETFREAVLALAPPLRSTARSMALSLPTRRI